MKGQELVQEQRLKIYQMIGFAQFVGKEKICLKYINSIDKLSEERLQFM